MRSLHYSGRIRGVVLTALQKNNNNSNNCAGGWVIFGDGLATSKEILFRYQMYFIPCHRK